ncbi:MAG: NAD(P)-dependent oxidoreductase, partial [Planctomycetota bacterium]
MPIRPNVIIADYINDDLQCERGILGDLADVVALDAYCEADLAGRIEDAVGIMLYHNVAITRSVIERLKCCKVIARCGVGFDNVDCAAAKARGIAVTNVPDYGTEEVADSAIGMALALSRGFYRLNTIYRREDRPTEWNHEVAAPIHRLRTRTMGIVGLGRIGTAVARRANAIGMRVIYHDPLLPDDFSPLVDAQRVASLRELIEQSYIVTLHCPLNDSTRNLINPETIEWFAPGSYLVNTSRGAVVDTRVNPDAIASGRL